MDLTAVFSNDQIAVLGCFGALATCGLIAAMTFHFGAAGKNSHSVQNNSEHLKIRSTHHSNRTEQKKAA